MKLLYTNVIVTTYIDQYRVARCLNCSWLEINEVEAARDNKETPLEKYPAGSINLINYGIVINSSIVQGGFDISNIETNVNIVSNDLEKIKKFVELVQAEYLVYALTSAQKSEVKADIKSIKSQIVSPKPKIDIVKQIGGNVLEIVKPFASEAIKEFGMSLFGRI